MTREDKELLLKDLCGRLPYGLKYNFGGYDGCDYTMNKVSLSAVDDAFPIEEVKPYLFPLSSMSLDQTIEYSKTLVIFDESHCSQTSETYDWFNRNRLDYRGLIPMGLALDATGLNIY